MEIKNNLLKLIEDIKLSQQKDLFNTPIVVLDNLNAEQWFKTNWLKEEKDIYMNIKCVRFKYLYENIFDTFNKILDINSITKIIIKLLSSDNINKPDYILDNNGIINQIRLYDYSKKMASLFYEYDNDCYEIEDNIQKELYDKVNEYALSLNYVSLKGLINNYKMKDLRHPVFVFITRKLNNIEKLLIEKYNNTFNEKIKIYELNNINQNKGNILNVYSCPNRLREIEILHSNICELINSGVNISDISVYSPVLGEYQNDIIRVFKQNDINYPNLSYVLSLTKNNYILDVIKVISKIIKNGYCTRNDFIKIISNESIKYIYKLSNDDVDTLINVLFDTSSYRNRSESDEYDFNDWKVLKERIILSKIVGESSNIDNIVSLDNDIIPYGNIGLNDDLKIILISILSFIIELLDINITDSAKSSLNKLNKAFNDLFGNDNLSYMFRMVLKELELFNTFKINESDNVNIEIILYSLEELAKYNILEGIPFSTGITFLNLNEKNVLENKYVFIIGFSSKNYPRTEISDSLNLNKNKENITELDTKIFNNIINNSNNIYISYVGEDLKKGDKFFPSLLIGDNYNIEYIDLDEKREDLKLFTRREVENKKYYQGLIENKDLEIIKDLDNEAQSRPQILNASQLSGFLDEPLKEKAKYLFGVYDDGSLEKMNILYEPIELDNIDKSGIVSELLKSKYENKNIDEIIKLYKLQNKLPRYDFDNLEIDKIINIIDEIHNHYIGNNYEIKKLSNINLSFNVLDLINYEKDIIDKEIKLSNVNQDGFKKLIDDYNDELKELDKIFDNYNKLLNDKNNLDLKIDELKNKIKIEKDKTLKQALNLEKQELSDNLSNLKDEIKNIDEIIKEYKDKYNSSNKSKESISEGINKKIIKTNKDLEDINNKINNLCNYKNYLDNNQNNDEIINWEINIDKEIYLKEIDNELSFSLLKYKTTNSNNMPKIDNTKDISELYIYSLIYLASIDNKYDNYKINYSIASEYPKGIVYPEYNIEISRDDAIFILNRIYYEFIDFNINAYIDGDIYNSNYDIFSKAISSNGKWKYYKDKYMFDIERIYEINNNLDKNNLYPMLVFRHSLFFK